MERVVVLVDLPDAHVRPVRHRLPDGGPLALAAALGGTPWLVLLGPDDVDVLVPDAAAPLLPGGRYASVTAQEDDLPAAVLDVTAQGLDVTGPVRVRLRGDGAVQVAVPVEEPPTGG